MPVFALDNRNIFPPVELSEEDGLLAVGGDLSVERLLVAYKHGIFPWYEGDSILWWCPDPRFVLFPENLTISKSMQKLLRQDSFEFSVNRDFKQVIDNCKTVYRRNQNGTWITPDVKEAYIKFHHAGYAHSAEAWLNNKLVGGLYGVKIGKIFFGESMFSTVSNASKYVFIKFVQQLKEEGIKVIDCQVYTQHLESLGASMIPRELFLNFLSRYL
jgi:leucyl/phenylalanyl-tRNA--protein transferase